MPFFVVFAFALPHRGSPPRDAWFGVDKVKHFVVAAVVETAGYAAFHGAGLRPRASLTGATLLTAGASVGKEIFDRRRTGLFSVRDLAWDAAWGGTAFVILQQERP